jgi:hypothetical protein
MVDFPSRRLSGNESLAIISDDGLDENMGLLKNSSTRLAALLGAFLLLSILSGAGPLAAQDDARLRVTDVDISAFPTVHVRLIAVEGDSVPATGIGDLVLREDGVPIPDRQLASVPAGIDLAVVLDANPAFIQADDNSGVTRRDKVVASLARFSADHMNPGGLDRISVIAPDAAGTAPAFLAEDVARPAELDAAMAGYAPAPPRVTPLNDMMLAALDHLEDGRDDGRMQALLLFTDGARLPGQLDYAAITEQALRAGIPIFSVILGREASPEELDAVNGLSGPTNGQVVHMPEPEATDPFYQLFEQLGQQTEVQYRSLTREPGEHEVAVNLGNSAATGSFSLDLQAPVIRLEIADTEITRAGSAVDTPLPLLQPAVVPLVAALAWPDGLPRGLAEFSFLVDGVAQPLPGPAAPDAAGHIPLAWDVSDLGEGTYTLEARGRDDLGFTFRSDPVPVTLSVSLPRPPTPEPAPTPVPPPALPLPIDLDDPRQQLALGAAGLLLAGLLALWAFRRRAAARAAQAAAAQPPPQPAPAGRPDDAHIPYLERLNASGAVVARTAITGSDLTIGRDADYATFIIDDPSVSRLHARVRRRTDDTFWLYDEGSAGGTFLNYDRLGLAPRRMAHGDAVTIGRVSFRFTLELPAPADRAAPGGDAP